MNIFEKKWSDMMSFPLLRTQKHSFPSPLPSALPCLLFTSLFRACSPMPKLKLTCLQIKEQAARDIRRRTLVRRAQLLEEQKQNTARDRERLLLKEDIHDPDSETEDCEDPEPPGLSYNVQLCFLVLLLFFLLYHACKWSEKVHGSTTAKRERNSKTE
jgi:hypothetical protein